MIFYPAGSKRPVELVVDKIDKDRISGYVSEPKHYQIEVAAGGPNGSEPASSTASRPASASDKLPHRPQNQN